MKTKKFIRIMFLAILTLTTFVSAKVTLPALVSDNMVLQRNAFVKIWGSAQSGSNIEVSVQWQKIPVQTLCNDEGKWQVIVKTPSDKGPYDIAISDGEPVVIKNILLGEVWLCSGQSNMSFGFRSTDTAEQDKSKADYPEIRYFGVNKKLADVPQDDCVGKWLVCKPNVAAWYSGVAYYFAQKVHTSIDVPIGIIQAAIGGTPADSWMSEEVLLSEPDMVASVERYNELMKSYPSRYEVYQKQLAKWQEITDNTAPKPRVPMGPEHFQRPYGFWNGMISPLLNYRIAGVLWYQGEGNSWRADQYRNMFPTLINSWRQYFEQGDFPFYFVQISPYKYGTPLIAAELRQAQTETLSLANTAMVCTMDIGDNDDIHPRNKKDVGLRLAGIALNRIYHEGNKVDSGPMYAGLDLEAGSLRIYFSNADSGLVVKDSGKYFEIAGENGVYLPAKVVVDGNSVLLSSEKVPSPKNARYGWSNTAGASLFNADDLPTVPFRTDNSDWTTEGKLTYF